MSQEHVILNVHLQAAPGREEEVAEQLQKLVAPTRAEPGCVTYILHRDPNDAGKFMFYEEFLNQDALDAHTKTTHLQQWVGYQTANPGLMEKSSVTYWRSIS
jgi:quinol monooxygenase YgiN